MADEKIIEEVRVLKRGGGASAIFATLAIVIAIVSLVFAVRAHNQERTLQSQLDTTTAKVTSLSSQVTKIANTVDQSAANAANSTSTNNLNSSVPNASGQ